MTSGCCLCNPLVGGRQGLSIRDPAPPGSSFLRSTGVGLGSCTPQPKSLDQGQGAALPKPWAGGNQAPDATQMGPAVLRAVPFPQILRLLPRPRLVPEVRNVDAGRWGEGASRTSLPELECSPPPLPATLRTAWGSLQSGLDLWKHSRS